jgi:uncharacterized membrane protein YagU involved in acid resistance
MNLFKGLLAGALAGVAASWVMERFQEQWVLSEVAPGPTFTLGAVYGVAVALGVDEVLVPALGLSRPAREVPPSQHAYNLASHLVYGVTLEGARRILRVLL